MLLGQTFLFDSSLQRKVSLVRLLSPSEMKTSEKYALQNDQIELESINPPVISLLE